MKMKYIIVALCLIATPSLAQQKDRKDYLIEIIQASRSYSDMIGANCFADNAVEIEKLKAKIKELEDKSSDKK